MPSHLKTWMSDFFRNNHRLRAMRDFGNPGGEGSLQRESQLPKIDQEGRAPSDSESEASSRNDSLVPATSDHHVYDELVNKFPTQSVGNQAGTV